MLIQTTKKRSLDFAPLCFAGLLILASSSLAQANPLAGSGNVLSPQYVGQDEEAEEEEEEAPPEDKREVIKEGLKTLKAHAKKRGDEDAEVVSTVEMLMNEFPKSGPKDRAAIAKGIAGCFDQKRKQNDEGVYDNKIYLASAEALSHMGPESVPHLIKMVGHKKHKANIVLQARVVQSLGKTKSEDGVDTLTNLLGGHTANEIEQAAAQALGNFGDLGLKKRKKIFGEVLKSLMSAKNDKDDDINNEDPSKAKRYNAVSASMLSTMETLSGHKESTPEEWQSWWNKNKKKDRDEVEEG